jgi:hypothetical protein
VSEPDASYLASYEAAMSMLEPLAGLLLSREVRYAQAEDLLKSAYVQASARAVVAQGKVPTVSNLSVATGIRRREVKRLLEMPVAAVSRKPSVAAQARLRWATDPDYLDATGAPLRLPRTAADDAPSFARLAATVSKDMHARALLDEMLRLGAVELNGDVVVLRHRTYQPPREVDELTRIAGVNVGAHLSAALINILSGDAVLPEKAVVATKLTEASARHAAELARSAWSEVLNTLRDKLQVLVDLDSDAPDNQWRARIGIYAYYAPMDRPPVPVAESARGKSSEPAAPRPTRSQHPTATTRSAPPPRRAPTKAPTKRSKP